MSGPRPRNGARSSPAVGLMRVWCGADVAAARSAAATSAAYACGLRWTRCVHAGRTISAALEWRVHNMRHSSAADRAAEEDVGAARQGPPPMLLRLESGAAPLGAARLSSPHSAIRTSVREAEFL